MSREHEWVDDDAGPVVRPYAVARGRTRPASSALDLLATVVSTGMPAPPNAELSAQHRRVIACLSGKGRPVVEVASDVGLPVGVVRVLLSDLLEHGLVSVRQQREKGSSPTESLLREVINGLRAL
ncbi:DUF742 domain-containing protein [Nonomuraea sp. H19]|uniref:DUF742 domain-containing protein n=1 Tax=Nonomuraea sp. H19 TaxID=3452206 RepID=UPI003F8C0C01